MHEAGHAVASLSLPPAPWIDQVWIKRSPEGWFGETCYQHRFQWALVDIPFDGTPEQAQRYEDLKRLSAYQEILVSMAGPLAEIRWRTRSRWNAIFSGADNADICLTTGGSEDFRCVRRYLEWLSTPNLRHAFVEAWGETEKLLHKNWKAVVGIGRLLKDKQRLTDEELQGAWDSLRREDRVA